MKYRCDYCERLIEIHPNGADPTKTSRRQQMEPHPKVVGEAELCKGSWKNV